ncbi:MAG TPA: hypothetical protein PKL48_09570 [Thermodesulfobacteriota bacterium]|nr:hypothetical protein [Thermodesulfobacteriota bacterium]
MLFNCELRDELDAIQDEAKAIPEEVCGTFHNIFLNFNENLRQIEKAREHLESCATEARTSGKFSEDEFTEFNLMLNAQDLFLRDLIKGTDELHSIFER